MTTKRTLTKGLLSGVLLLVAALSLPATTTAQNRRYDWDNWNRRYNRHGSGTFQLDGTFVDQRQGCALVQDHSGQVIPLVGNPGDLRRGEHLLVSGRVERGTVCGTAFRVSRVDRIWADARHRRVLFDRRQDGDYNSRYAGRYRDRDRYDDDRYDDDRNDRGENRNLVSLSGRLDDSGSCPVIRGDRGEYYDLIGDLRGFEDGDRARVVGFLGVRSRCGGQAIDVQEIIR
jgi:hypothetical protein